MSMSSLPSDVKKGGNEGNERLKEGEERQEERRDMGDKGREGETVAEGVRGETGGKWVREK